MTRHSMDKDALAALAAINRQHAWILLIQGDIRSLVALALNHGAPWSAVGKALDVSTQAAWERYRPESTEEPIPGQRALWEDEPE